MFSVSLKLHTGSRIKANMVEWTYSVVNYFFFLILVGMTRQKNATVTFSMNLLLS